MKYPQAYLVIHKDFAMPALQTLKAWAQPCQDFYVPSICESDENLNKNISVILEIHSYLSDNWSRDDQFIVLMCDKIPKFLLLGLGESILDIYWLDDQTSADMISEIITAFKNYEDFKESFENAVGELSRLCETINSLNCDDQSLENQYDFLDDFNEELFVTQLDDNHFKLSELLKRSCADITHSDDLTRNYM
jgi:hypothetical protein